MYFCVYCVPRNGETAVCVRRDNDLFVIRISAEDTINQYFVAKKEKIPVDTGVVVEKQKRRRRLH